MSRSKIPFQTKDGKLGHLEIHVGMDGDSMVIAANLRNEGCSIKKLSVPVSQNLAKKIMAFVDKEFGKPKKTEDQILVHPLIFTAIEGNYQLKFLSCEIPGVYNSLYTLVTTRSQEYSRRRRTRIKERAETAVDSGEVDDTETVEMLEGAL